MEVNFKEFDHFFKRNLRSYVWKSFLCTIKNANRYGSITISFIKSDIPVCVILIPFAFNPDNSVQNLSTKFVITRVRVFFSISTPTRIWSREQCFPIGMMHYSGKMNQLVSSNSKKTKVQSCVLLRLIPIRAHEVRVNRQKSSWPEFIRI